MARDMADECYSQPCARWFGFAQERLAELEFSFGHTGQALAALKNSLEVAPRNAQAVALNGFLLSAQNRITDAIASFNHAIELDGSLGNAWLGRGLCNIKLGRRTAADFEGFARRCGDGTAARVASQLFGQGFCR